MRVSTSTPIAGTSASAVLRSFFPTSAFPLLLFLTGKEGPSNNTADLIPGPHGDGFYLAGFAFIQEPMDPFQVGMLGYEG